MVAIGRSVAEHEPFIAKLWRIEMQIFVTTTGRGRDDQAEAQLADAALRRWRHRGGRHLPGHGERDGERGAWSARVGRADVGLLASSRSVRERTGGSGRRSLWMQAETRTRFKHRTVRSQQDRACSRRTR
jgi:hypothetical protein